MKAAVYDELGPPEVLRYADVPDPEIGPDDVLIDVEAISIEGDAAAGTVVAVGAHVTARKIGDRLTSFGVDGSHAALRRVPANQTWSVPDGVGWAHPAALPISFGTANHCLFKRVSLKSGEAVLVQAAAGGVGLAAIQLAKRAGALVIASSSGEGRLVFVGNARGGSLTADLWSAMQANQSLYGVFMGTQFADPTEFSTVDHMLRDVAETRIQVPIDRSFALDAHRHAEQGKPFGHVILHP